MDSRKDLSTIYERFIANPEEEIVEGELVEESLGRFALNDYTKLIDEGSHGDKKAIAKILDQGIEQGLLKKVTPTADGYMLYSAVDDSKFLSHRGENNYHYIRRYLEKLKKVAATLQPA